MSYCFNISYVLENMFFSVLHGISSSKSNCITLWKHKEVQHICHCGWSGRIFDLHSDNLKKKYYDKRPWEIPLKISTNVFCETVLKAVSIFAWETHKEFWVFEFSFIAWAVSPALHQHKHIDFTEILNLSAETAQDRKIHDIHHQGWAAHHQSEGNWITYYKCWNFRKHFRAITYYPFPLLICLKQFFAFHIERKKKKGTPKWSFTWIILHTFRLHYRFESCSGFGHNFRL